MKRIFRLLVAALFLGVATAVAVPLLTAIHLLCFDQGLRDGGSSSLAFKMHRNLSKRIPDYAERRIASGVAETLDVSEITATEWPVYGAYFYLLATGNLQQQWEQSPSPKGQSPAEIGADAIEASLRLMLDEGHAHWVRSYWGDDYLTEPNCFYRMLMIGSISSHHRLTGSDEHLGLLKELVDDLAGDIDRSPSGLIDDYPNQCFPADVGVAIAMIHRAGAVLGEDRTQWAKQALRRVHAHYDDGLPPYMAVAQSGLPTSSSRGCTNGFLLSFSRELDPEFSDQLYTQHIEHYWQQGNWCAGWREFADGLEPPGTGDLYMDPDSGPVVYGFGTSATGLGLGAARHHGDITRSFPLAAELVATAAPLPNGRLLIPSLVADHDHAPHFPEIVLLHQLSLTHPHPSGEAPRTPPIVWLILGTAGVLVILSARIGWGLLRPRRQKS